MFQYLVSATPVANQLTRPAVSSSTATIEPAVVRAQPPVGVKAPLGRLSVAEAVPIGAYQPGFGGESPEEVDVRGRHRA
jgi:hypothetical protein